MQPLEHTLADAPSSHSAHHLALQVKGAADSSMDSVRKGLYIEGHQAARKQSNERTIQPGPKHPAARQHPSHVHPHADTMALKCCC